MLGSCGQGVDASEPWPGRNTQALAQAPEPHPGPPSPLPPTVQLTLSWMYTMQVEAMSDPTFTAR